jgi:filamentous hemagglutinin
MTISTQRLRFLRGNTAAASAFTGLQGELIFDTTLYTLRLQDGVTPGGYTLATSAQLANVAANANYGNSNVGAYLTSYTGNLTAGNILSNNYLYANGVSILTGIQSNYGNANVAAYLVANPQPGTYSNTNVVSYLTSLSNVKVGFSAGFTNQGFSAVAIGPTAAANNQGNYAIAIGATTAQSNQGSNSIAIGTGAAAANQGIDAIAIGTAAGGSFQGNGSVAIGSGAGGSGGSDIATVAIGDSANVDGNYSIAIGRLARVTSASTIMFNATGSVLNSSGAGFYVDPIGSGTAGNVLYYNTSTKKITYGAASETYGNANVANYLPTYTGNIAGNIVKNGQTWTFGTDGKLTLPGNVSFTRSQQIYTIGTGASDNYITISANIQNNINGFQIGESAAGALIYTSGNVRLITNTADAEYTWTFDDTGNLSVPNSVNFNGGEILQSSNNDLIITVQDDNNDDYALYNRVTDTGVVLSEARLRRGDFQINFPNASKNFNFNDNGVLGLPGDIALNNQGGDISLYAIDNGSTGSAEIKTISYAGATLGSNIRVTQSAATISTGNAAHTWTFDNAGNVTVPGSIIAEFITSPAPKITGFDIDTTRVNVNGNVTAANFIGNIQGPSTVFGNLSVTGNLIVSGNTITVSTNNFVVSDNIIFMANNNPANILDIGFAAHYTTDALRHTGFVKDVTDGTWKLFSNVPQEITTTVNFTDAVYDPIRTGNITAPYFVGNGALLTGLAATYSNANVAAYLPTYTGNIAANIVKNGQTWTFESNGVLTVPGSIRNSDDSASIDLTLSSLRLNSNTGGSYIDIQLADIFILPNNGSVVLGASPLNWQFNANGNLSLPSNNSIIHYPNGASILDGITGGTGNYSNANVASYLPTYSGNLSAANISLTNNTSALTFNTGAYIYGDTVSRPGSVVLQPNTSVAGFPSVIVGGAGRLAAPNGSIHAIFNTADLTVQVPLKATSATAATSTSTGALTVSGGAGIVGNVYAGGAVVATGNVSGNFFIGNGALLTGIAASSNYGNANVAAYLTTYGGPVNANVITGTANATINGLVVNASATIGTTLGVTGNITAGNIIANQFGNSVGTTATYTANVTAGNLTLNGNIVDTGALSVITGSNGNINLNPNGTGVVTISSALTATGNITTANNISMSGGNISGVGNIIGTTSNTTITAGNYVTSFLSNGAVTTSSNVIVTGSNAISIPNLPAFRVYGNTSTQFLGGTTLTNQVVDYNQGSYYNNSTGLFTAPVAGLYHCYATVRVGSNNGLNQASIQKNSSTAGANVIAFWETDTNTGTAVHFAMTGYAKCVVGDTIRLQVLTGNVQFDNNDSWGITFIG